MPIKYRRELQPSIAIGNWKEERRMEMGRMIQVVREDEWGKENGRTKKRVGIGWIEVLGTWREWDGRWKWRGRVMKTFDKWEEDKEKKKETVMTTTTPLKTMMTLAKKWCSCCCNWTGVQQQFLQGIGIKKSWARGRMSRRRGWRYYTTICLIGFEEQESEFASCFHS